MPKVPNKCTLENCLNGSFSVKEIWPNQSNEKAKKFATCSETKHKTEQENSSKRTSSCNK